MRSAWARSCRWFAAASFSLYLIVGGAFAQSVEAIQADAEKEGSLVWYAAMRSEHIELIAARRDGHVQRRAALLPPVVDEQLAGPHRHGELRHESIAALFDLGLAQFLRALPHFAA